MEVIPDAQTAAAADPCALEVIIQPLGFQRFRALGIIAMSVDYLRPWARPSELRFIGKYASDAYWIFCRCGPVSGTGLLCSVRGMRVSLCVCMPGAHHVDAAQRVRCSLCS